MTNLTEQDIVRTEKLIKRKEDALKSLEFAISWVSNIDAKASYILAVAGIMIGYVLGQDLSAIKSVAAGQTVKQIIKSVLYIFCMLSFIFPILTLRVRVKPKVSSYFFFGSIATRKRIDFIEGFKQIKDDDSLDDILMQVHINSQICCKKVKLYNWGLFFLVCSIVICFACKIYGQI